MNYSIVRNEKAKTKEAHLFGKYYARWSDHIEDSVIISVLIDEARNVGRLEKQKEICQVLGVKP